MNGLEITAAKIHARYYPKDRKPYHDWERRTISVSKLVPYSATDYAGALIAKRDSVEEQEDNSKWGFLGNTIASAALADMAAHENNVAVSLGKDFNGDEWLMTGHFDGADAHEDGVVIAEHKFYLYNEAPSKPRDAMRQGSCYLSMGYYIVECAKTDVTFELGEYEEGVGKRFTWRYGLPPLGVVVALSPSHACEDRIELYPLSAQDCMDILAFYVGKAQAIRDSFINGNTKVAEAWDRAHPAEDIRPLKEVIAGTPIPDLDVLTKELGEVKAKLTPPPLPLDDGEVDLLESREAELRKLVLMKMADLGEKRVDIPGYRINRQTHEERLKPAEPERLIPAGHKLVVTRVKDREPKKAVAV